MSDNTPIMNEAKKLDGLRIKRVFEATEPTHLKGNFVDCWECEIRDVDDNVGYMMNLYAPTLKELESMRDNAMFGLNEADKLRDELAKAKEEIKRLKKGLAIDKSK